MRIRLSLIICIIGTLLYFSCKEKTKHSKKFIYDKAGIFEPKQYKYLDSVIRNYELNTTSEIFIYTVDKISDSANKIVDYSNELVNNLGVGKPGLNNGALLFLSLQDKRIDLRLAHGFEWLIKRKDRDSIVKQMTHFFSHARFFDGIDSAVNQIIKLTKKVPWSICKNANEDNCILKVKIKKIISKKDSTLKILTTDNRVVLLNYTEYMQHLVEKIENNNNLEVYYRVVSNSPRQAHLLGILQ